MIAGIINRPTFFVMAGKRYRSYNDPRGTVIGSSGISGFLPLYPRSTRT